MAIVPAARPAAAPSIRPRRTPGLPAPLAALAEITPADVEAAAAWWRRVAPPGFRHMADGPVPAAVPGRNPGIISD
jgi:hypothetical protein